MAPLLPFVFLTAGNYTIMRLALSAQTDAMFCSSDLNVYRPNSSLNYMYPILPYYYHYCFVFLVVIPFTVVSWNLAWISMEDRLASNLTSHLASIRAYIWMFRPCHSPGVKLQG